MISAQECTAWLCCKLFPVAISIQSWDVMTMNYFVWYREEFSEKKIGKWK